MKKLLLILLPVAVLGPCVLPYFLVHAIAESWSPTLFGVDLDDPVHVHDTYVVVVHPGALYWTVTAGATALSFVVSWVFWPRRAKDAEE